MANSIEVSIDNVRENDPACTLKWVLYCVSLVVNRGSMEAVGDDYTAVMASADNAYAFVAANFQPYPLTLI